jgi:hypothetical protein
MKTSCYPLATITLILFVVATLQTSKADEFHATRVGGSWTVTNVAPTPPYSTYTFNSLAIQPNNYPAFVYHEYGPAVWEDSFQMWMPSGAPGKLRYAEFNGDSWTTTVVDDDGNTGFSGSLAFDSSGTPHISYVSYSADTLRYAKRVNGTWQTSTLDYIGPYTGTDGTPQLQDVSATSLVIHPVTGNPTVSYLHQSSYTYRYGVLDSGVFTSEPVEYLASMPLKTLYPSEGRFMTHDLDSQGNPHLAYWTMNTADGTSGLEYATKDSQGNWSQATIDESGMTWYSDLKIGSDDLPRVAYHEQLPYSQANGFMGVLRFAELNDSVWQSTLVDGGTPREVSGADYVGWHPSLALDAMNTPHISYADVGGQAIKYATRSDGAWLTEVIDDGTYMIGLMSSLAIDSSGNMHVAYDPPVAPVPEPSTLALFATAAAFVVWRRTKRTAVYDACRA